MDSPGEQLPRESSPAYGVRRRGTTVADGGRGVSPWRAVTDDQNTRIFLLISHVGKLPGKQPVSGDGSDRGCAEVARLVDNAEKVKCERRESEARPMGMEFRVSSRYLSLHCCVPLLNRGILPVEIADGGSNHGVARGAA
jgi:hypothetical protein